MWERERALAVEAARIGGAAALAHFRRPALQVEYKADASPVTRADREAEAAIRSHLAAARPDDGWLGEESGGESGGSDWRWVVDPIDGTRNFVQGIPLWSTLVACEQRQGDGSWRVVASSVLFPGLDEGYEASLGGGASCNGVPIRVSACPRLGEALWCFETPQWFRRAGLGEVFEHLLGSTRLQRGLCDAYAHMLIASGRAELMIEPSLSRWDMAAPSLIVSEAGGRFTDLSGRPGIDGSGCVSSNGLLHDEALALLAGAGA
jgi:histidinol-phosphatase